MRLQVGDKTVVWTVGNRSGKPHDRAMEAVRSPSAENEAATRVTAMSDEEPLGVAVPYALHHCFHSLFPLTASQ